MDSMSAFEMGEANRGKPLMVFDWDKAATLIRQLKPTYVEAGLAGDWGYTGGAIYKHGSVVRDEYTYLASTWARPQLQLDDEIVDCFVMESETDWNSETKWPESAVSILEQS